MPNVSLSGLVIVAAAAFLAPLLLGLTPARRLPSVVLEIMAGIVIGPAVLGWVQVDTAIQLLAMIGLAYLAFLAGLEIDFDRLKGRPLAVTGAGFVLSCMLALLLAYGFYRAGLVEAPLLIAIILVSTAFGIVVPILKDAGEVTSGFGQLVIAGASIADFGAIILLSLFFSREATSTVTQVVLLGALALLGLAAFFAIARAEHSASLSQALRRLQNTTAQIRVRGAFLLLLIFVALAQQTGLEVILGAFIAGVVLRLVDRDQLMTHPQFRVKLDAVGFGVFIPIFFVASGLRFDLGALFADASTVLRVPLLLAALIVVRAVPALVYGAVVDRRRVVVAGLLQATSLPFIVAAVQIGLEIGLLDPATGAALIAAGLLSVVVFPVAALGILQDGPPVVKPPRAEPLETAGPMP